MDTSALFMILRELVFLLVTAGGFLTLALTRGTQLVINVILGLYFALLITLQFPYFTSIFNAASGSSSQPALFITFFVLFTIAGLLFFNRLLPTSDFESGITDFKRKIVYSLCGTVLVAIISLQVLPVTEFITLSEPITRLFGAEQSFFWWLLLPFAAIYIFRN